MQSLKQQIPLNGLRSFNKSGRDICVGRNSSGVYAVRNKCPHQGYAFNGGVCTEQGKIVCPVHRYGFDVLTGRGGGTAVDVYKIEERADGVYVGVEYTSLF